MHHEFERKLARLAVGSARLADLRAENGSLAERVALTSELQTLRAELAHLRTQLGPLV